MKLRDFRPGDSFCLQAGGPVYKVVEHVAGLRELVRCSSVNPRLGRVEEHHFSAQFLGLPVSLVNGPAEPALE